MHARLISAKQKRRHAFDRIRLGFESLEARRLLATVYYVDSSAGSDANLGTSTSSAWASLAKVKATLLAPGDTVLLKRGSAWNESLDLSRSGTDAAPIQVAAYGSGSAPQVFRVYITGSNTTVEDLLVDHQRQTGDAVLIRNANNVERILNEWRLPTSYATRSAHLSSGGGINGSYRLNRTTVARDSARDLLFGDAGLDWYLMSVTDALADLSPGELSAVI